MDTRLYFEQIQQGCRRALDFTTGLDFQDFVADWRTYDAVMHNLEVIGTAASKIPKEAREEYPGLQWREIMVLPHLVTHLHFGIQDEILWDLVQTRLPQWLLEVSRILQAKQ